MSFLSQDQVIALERAQEKGYLTTDEVKRIIICAYNLPTYPIELNWDMVQIRYECGERLDRIADAFGLCVNDIVEEAYLRGCNRKLYLATQGEDTDAIS